MKQTAAAGLEKVCSDINYESTDIHQKQIDIVVENNPTILPKIIQTITRRRIVIHSLMATRYPGDPSLGKIKIILETDAEKVRLIETQLKKLVDVLEVK